MKGMILVGKIRKLLSGIIAISMFASNVVFISAAEESKKEFDSLSAEANNENESKYFHDDASGQESVTIDGVIYSYYPKSDLIIASVDGSSEVTDPVVREEVDGYSVYSLTVKNNSAVKTINIPSGVSKLEIRECPELKEVSVDEDNLYFSSSDGVLFDKEGKKLFYYPPKKEGKVYRIPDGVEKIGNFLETFGNVFPVFDSCESLESIIIPDSVNFISYYSVYRCDNIEYIEIPGNDISIHGTAFCNNTKLKEVCLLCDYLFAHDKSFEGCTSISKVTFSRTVPFKVDYMETTVSADAYVDYDDCLGFATLFGGYGTKRLSVDVYTPDENFENYKFSLGGINEYTLHPSSEKEKCRPGDVNKNGSIEIHDMVDTERYFLGKKTADDLATDVDEDGTTNIIDFIKVKNEMLKIY
jgi:hypothetical protein